MYKVLIYDEDQRYLKKLIEQLSQKKTPHFLFTACSTEESLGQQLSSSETFQIFVHSECKVLEPSMVSTFEYDIRLGDYTCTDVGLTISKYQEIKGFLRDLKKILSIGEYDKIDESQYQMNIVLSAEGGSGKTTLAIALAKYYGKDFSTLLLSFETQSDLSNRLDLQGTPTMTDLFYYVMRSDSNDGSGFNNQLKHDDYLGFTALAPFDSYGDIKAIKLGDVQDCLNLLKKNCRFERIVIDSNGYLDDILEGLLLQASHVWIVKGDHRNSHSRLKLLLKDIELVSSKKTIETTIKVIKNSVNAVNVSDEMESMVSNLPFDLDIEETYRAQIYSVLSRPYYRALSALVEGN